MRIESSYVTSQLLGSTPYGKAEIHRVETDNQGHKYHTVEQHPFFSYSAYGRLEAVKEIGKNIDKLV
jgi:hypothetical protein